MDLSNYQQKRFVVGETFEYKVLGDEIYQHFKLLEGPSVGRRIFPLFSSPRFTHLAIRDAWKEYLQQEVRSFRYFVGILNKKRVDK